MTNTQIIRDFYNRIIGYIETDAKGNKTVRNAFRRLIGTYDVKHNVTRDFYNRIIAKGDVTTSLLPIIHS